MIGKLLEDHLAVLPALADIALGTLGELDADAGRGTVQVTYASHIGLEPRMEATLLAEHLPSSVKTPGFVPEAFAYRISADERPDIVDMRLVVVKSLVYKDAVFLECSAVYTGGKSSSEIFEKMRKDYDGTLANLGLRLRTGGGN